MELAGLAGALHAQGAAAPLHHQQGPGGREKATQPHALPSFPGNPVIVSLEGQWAPVWLLQANRQIPRTLGCQRSFPAQKVGRQGQSQRALFSGCQQAICLQLMSRDGTGPLGASATLGERSVLRGSSWEPQAPGVPG